MRDFISGFKGQPLDIKQIAIGMHLCYKNAKNLADETRLLRNNDHYARAFSLTILGLEEIGKIPLICNMILYKKDDTESWRKFWKDFQTHQIKLGVWTVYGKRILHAIGKDYKAKLPSGFEPLVDRFKQLGFYVSFFKGQFLLPEDFAKDNKKWLDYFLKILEERVIRFSPYHGSPEKSEKFINNGIEIFTRVSGAKTIDEIEKVLTEWISQHGMQQDN